MPGTIHVSCLGKLGRFGNQCFQYAFARGYAASVGATLETPWWVGKALFNLDDPFPSKHLPALRLDEHPDGRVDIDLWGYFQHAKFFDSYTLTNLREWFTPRCRWLDQFPKPHKCTLTTHIRRGDYLTTYANIFCTIAEEAYIKAITNAGFDPKIRLEVREDNPSAYPIPGLEWVGDFFALYHSDIMFRANSTFSWWAATLGQTRIVHSPIIEGLTGYQTDVKFVEGNWPRCVNLNSVSDYHIKP